MSVPPNRPDAGAAYLLQQAATSGLALGAVPTDPKQVLADLRSLLAMLVVLCHQLGGLLGTEALEEKPRLITPEEFAKAYGGVSAKTVEAWCRRKRFPCALGRDKSGWRIPEFYLYSDHPPAHLAKWFPVKPNSEAEVGAESNADASGRATPKEKKPRASKDEVPAVEQSATETEPSSDMPAAETPSAVTEPAPKKTSDGFDVTSFDPYRSFVARSVESPLSKKPTRAR